MLQYATEVKHRRHGWLGHVLRMEQKRVPKKDLRWNPPGKAKNDPGKTFEGDFKKMGNCRERSKRVTFMEEKEQLHYFEWIEAIKKTGKNKKENINKS